MTIHTRLSSVGSWWVLILTFVMLSACATGTHTDFRSGWVNDVVPGTAVTKADSNVCTIGKSPEEIAKLTWVVVSITHLRSVRYLTLPLSSQQFTPRRGERVLVNVAACQVQSAR